MVAEKRFLKPNLVSFWGFIEFQLFGYLHRCLNPAVSDIHPYPYNISIRCQLRQL